MLQLSIPQVSYPSCCSCGEAAPTPTLAYVGEAVASPLRWMVATGASRGLRGLGDVRAAADAREAEGLDGTIRVSVSRLGSGSHLMACLLAAREGWPTSRLSFWCTRISAPCGGAWMKAPRTCSCGSGT